MYKFLLVIILLLNQIITFGQCSEFNNFHYLELDSLMKKNNVNFITDSKFGIFYSKFYIDRYTGEIHILKSINVVDSFDVQIDTALFNDLNSNYFALLVLKSIKIKWLKNTFICNVII